MISVIAVDATDDAAAAAAGDAGAVAAAADDSTLTLVVVSVAFSQCRCKVVAADVVSVEDPAWAVL